MILLQIVSDVATEAETLPTESVSFFELIGMGGFMMIPITLLFVLAVYLVVERVMLINKADDDPEPFMTRVKDFVVQGDLKGSKAFCSQVNTPVARMIEKGISRIGSPMKHIEASIENAAKGEVFKLEKHLSIIATISGAAPMFGFLGTVTGMIKAFNAIAQEQGAVSPALLSSGIYAALVTTAWGLIVGILAYLAHNYLVSSVEKIAHKMEYSAIDFIDLLQEPR